jgi:16S rRNA (uracil1498-N3)-methyltransferase
MRSPRVYHPNLTAGRLTLDENEAHHIVRVLRMEGGDEVELFVGHGGLAEGRIASVERARVTVEVETPRRLPFDLKYRVTLAVAMSKAHRQSYLVEKCTELGVAALWPVLSERSVTRPAEAAVDKWSRRAIEAAKQSLRAWVPRVESPLSLAEAVARHGDFQCCVVAAPSSVDSCSKTLEALPVDASVLALIGPEGGWTPAELQSFTSVSIRPVALSPTVLRTETAAVAICAAAAMLSCGGAR